jgi:flagellar motility protein MotE (MotC chaperone)
MKLRVLPLVMASAGLLLVLKAAGLVLTGHYAFEPPSRVVTAAVAIEPTYRPSAAARTGNSWNMPADGGTYDPVITGSLPPKKPKPEPSAEPKPEATVPAADVKEGDAQPAEGATSEAVPADAIDRLHKSNPDNLSSAEKALLDRLQSRRQELDTRSQELDLRENLLRAAEKKIEEQLAELKVVEDRIAAAEEARKVEEDNKLKDLVIMYENMKPKEAAAIFDVMDMKVLVEVAGKMAPKKAGDVIAKMEPAAAERLTVALAKREEAKAAAIPANPANLPKIEGQKTN